MNTSKIQLILNEYTRRLDEAQHSLKEGGAAALVAFVKERMDAYLAAAKDIERLVNEGRNDTK